MTDDEIEPEAPKITFEQFKEFFKANRGLDNVEIYKAFPSVKQGTLRSWKAKAKVQLIVEEASPEIEEEEPPEETVEPEVSEEEEEEKLIADAVKEALKIERKTPSEAVPSNQPLSREQITKNWFEVVV